MNHQLLRLVVLLALLAITVMSVSTKTKLKPKNKRQETSSSSPSTAATYQTHRQVLVVSLDGFKWNYIDSYRQLLGNITRVSKNVRAAYTTPVFPSYTFPNHYSIATGVYPETHGIVHNTFLVPEIHAQFVKSKTEEIYWNGFEPIWITATRQKVDSGIYLWPGSMTKIGGITPRYYEPVYSDSIPWQTRVDAIVKWLADDRVNLAMLYYHEPDKTSHIHGPESEQVISMLTKANENIGYLLDKMDSRDLLGQVDIIICSDHGLTMVDKTKIVVLADLFEGELIDKYFDPRLKIESWAHGSVIHLWPRPEMILEVYNLLRGKTPHIDFYLKEDIPERLHHRHSSRISPIVGIAKLGWRAVWYKDDLNLPKVYGSLGAHGYDNTFSDMRAAFFAMGPSFKTHITLAPFETLNIYALIAELSGIKPRRTNATINPFLPALRRKPHGTKYYESTAESGPLSTYKPVTTDLKSSASLKSMTSASLISAALLCCKQWLG